MSGDALTLCEVQRRAYATAVARGQWAVGADDHRQARSVLETEARRALAEETREVLAALSRWSGAHGSDDDVADELADVVIAAASIAQALGIDLERAVADKMRRNEERAAATGQRC